MHFIKLLYLLKSFHMKGKYRRWGGDQHLLQGISVDVLFRS